MSTFPGQLHHDDRRLDGLLCLGVVHDKMDAANLCLVRCQYSQAWKCGSPLFHVVRERVEPTNSGFQLLALGRIRLDIRFGSLPTSMVRSDTKLLNT